jgi:alkaline phosphatase D
MLSVEYSLDPHFAQPRTGPSGQTVSATAATDFTATIKLNDLIADTVYHYRVWFSDQTAGTEIRSPYALGSLRTAPAATTRRTMSFVFGGDLGGQQYCRPREQGYAIFDKMRELNPDFFIANGDMIYANNDCPAQVLSTPERQGWQNVPGDFPRITARTVDWTDLAQLQTVFLQHWRYHRADPAFQRFLQRVPIYVQWDDHEVVNDFGAKWTSWKNGKNQRQGYQNVVQAGRETLFLYAPIDQHPDEPHRIYRSFRWGKDLEIFLLDARSYRSRNDLPDTPENSKTMLGAEQLQWLKQSLVGSTATWKVVSSDVPLSIPTGSNPTVRGRDGWANGPEPSASSLTESSTESSDTNIAFQTGFERELFDLLGTLDTANVQNLVFVTTDVHFATSLEYAVDADGDTDMLHFHEFVTGPLSAISVPAKTQQELDPSLNPRLVYAEGELKNFALVRIEEQADGKVHLIADVRGEDGLVRAGSKVDLVARP